MVIKPYIHMSNSDVHQRDANECELWNKISITRLIKLILIFEDFMDIYRPLKIFILKVLLSSSIMLTSFILENSSTKFFV